MNEVKTEREKPMTEETRTPVEQMQIHELTDYELHKLTVIEDMARPHLTLGFRIFLEGCEAAGFRDIVAGSAFSSSILLNVTRILILATGMDSEEIDPIELNRISDETEVFLASQVDAYIRKSNLANRAARDGN